MSKWEMVKLGDVCEMNPSKKELAAVDREVEVSFVPMADLQANQIHFEVRDTKKVCEVIKGYTYFKNNDVLLAKITPCFENGKSGVVTNLVNGIGFGSTEFIVFRPGEKVLPEWIYYCISNNNFLNAGKNNMTGSAGQQRISQKFIKDYKISIPSVEEQKKIAKTIDTAFELIVLRKKQLAELDNLIKSTFCNMFGDPVTNEKGWEVAKLGCKCNIITGNTPPRADKGNYGDFIEWIKSDNINTDGMYLTCAEEYLSAKGFKLCRYVDELSVLMTCIAGSIKCIGNVAIADRKVSFNQQINAIIPKENNVFYIYILLLLNQEYIQSTINMSLKGILSKGRLSELQFIFPPIELQNKFAEIVIKIEEQKALIKKAIDESQYLFDSLMSEYFE